MLTGVATDTGITREETFGPVASLHRFNRIRANTPSDRRPSSNRRVIALSHIPDSVSSSPPSKDFVLAA